MKTPVLSTSTITSINIQRLAGEKVSSSNDRSSYLLASRVWVKPFGVKSLFLCPFVFFVIVGGVSLQGNE
jgi:hypothetical protein